MTCPRSAASIPAGTHPKKTAHTQRAGWVCAGIPECRQIKVLGVKMHLAIVGAVGIRDTLAAKIRQFPCT